jgi:hypothetical protein
MLMEVRRTYKLSLLANNINEHDQWFNLSNQENEMGRHAAGTGLINNCVHQFGWREDGSIILK